jgi:hypothetical protein
VGASEVSSEPDHGAPGQFSSSHPPVDDERNRHTFAMDDVSSRRVGLSGTRTSTIDPSCINERYRASGLNLIVAAIVLWNTVYLERAIKALRGHGVAIDDEALVHVSLIGWEHINLTGDYTWQASGRLWKGSFRPLRPFAASNE